MTTSTTAPLSDVKALMKILIGAAWIDGSIQPEERTYLHRIAKERGVADDPEIQPLLHELRAVTPDECYRWVHAYLDDPNHPNACQQLMEELSALIYSDGMVEIAEAKLLNELQQMGLTCEGSARQVLSTIRRLYQHWLARLDIQNH